MRQRDKGYGATNPGNALLLMVVAPFLLYFGAAAIVSYLTGQPYWSVPAWTPDIDYPVWGRAAVLIFGLTGVAIGLMVPALPWAEVLAGRRLRTAALVSRAFAINVIQTAVLLGLCKAIWGSVPSRSVFVLWQAIIGVGGLLLWNTRVNTSVSKRQTGRSRIVLVGVTALLLALPAVLWNKTFVENGSGDGTEAFEFSRSLAVNQLPHWDLENGYYGFYPSFMLFSYPAQLAFITIGEGEAGQRVPVYFYLFGIYVTLAEIVRRRRQQVPWSELALLAGAAAYYFGYHAFRSTYEIVSDIAEPTGVDVFFTFLAFAAVYSLITRRRLWWGVFSLMGCLALPAGLPFAILFLVGHHVRRLRVPWRPLALDTLAFVVPWICYQTFVRVYASLFPMGTPKWALTNILNQYPFEYFSLAIFVPLVVSFAWSVGFVPIIGTLGIGIRDRIGRVLAITAVGYFLLLVVFARVHPHYLIPIGLLPIGVVLRAAAHHGVPRRVRFAVIGGCAASLMATAIATRPPSLLPHTAFRDVGMRTLIMGDSYTGAVQAATEALALRPELRLHLPVGRPPIGEPREVMTGDDMVVPWTAAFRAVPHPYGLSQHILVRYADRHRVAGRDYDQILADPQRAPQRLDGFLRRDLPGGWILFVRPDITVFRTSSIGRGL